MADKFKVAKVPCGSCPYRKSTPSGVWAEEEYHKLIEYDADTSSQPPMVFLCHDGDADRKLCKGWLACHGWELLAVRLAVIQGMLDVDETTFESPVPLHKSGRAAAEHGLRNLEQPDSKAQRMQHKLLRKHPRLGGQ